jgi:predicted RNA binding protein YcfA (HicA-like mRNA interferase family)
VVTKLPEVDARRLARALQRAGFKLVRQSGSHAAFRHADGRTVEVPMHDRDLKTGTLAAILKEAGITADELRELE